MPDLLLFNKPYQVLSQFSDDKGRVTLKQFIPDKPGFYVAGRLDFDSEGLLLLTNNGKLQHRISEPDKKMAKTYWVQVEGCPDQRVLETLSSGIELKDGKTRPAKAKLIDEPQLWSRTPPVRFRKSKPTQWLELTLTEGRNRQVRRMTAALGFPTLRLVRVSIGPWSVKGLLPGEYQQTSVNMPVSRPKQRR